MDIISWILFGSFVGITVNVISPSRNKGGIVEFAFMGIIGALVGCFFASLHYDSSIVEFSPDIFLIAVTGLLLLLFFGKTKNRQKRIF